MVRRLQCKRGKAGFPVVLLAILAMAAGSGAEASSRYILHVAGTGVAGYDGEGVAAATTRLWYPEGLCLDNAGNIYFGEEGGHRVRKINAATGLVTTVAGTGSPGYGGDGNAATAAQLNEPVGVFVDASNNIYIADRANHRVRKVEESSGNISTIAGTGSGGYNGDGIDPTTAWLYAPSGVWVDASGDVYIADRDNHRIRKIDTSMVTISTLAGDGTAGQKGDGMTATMARLNYPNAVALDTTGNIYIADRGNSSVRVIDTGGNIDTFAGISGQPLFDGDDGPATSAHLNSPYGVWTDSSDNVYIADLENHRIRMVDAVTGFITTIAGTGTASYNADGIPANSAHLQNPYGVCVDPSGTVYIGDAGNQRIRKLWCGPRVSVTNAQVPASPGAGETVTYRIIVTNTGLTTVSAWTVCDTVSASISAVTTDQPGVVGAPVVTGLGGGSGTRFVWSGTNLYLGVSYTFTITGTVGHSACDSGLAISNTAYIHVEGDCGSQDLATKAVGFSIPASAAGVSLNYTQSGNSFIIGNPFTYRIVVTNTGNVTLTAVTVTDSLPSAVVDVTADQPTPGFSSPAVSPGGSGTRFIWSATGLTFIPGATYTFTLSGRMGEVCTSGAYFSRTYATGANACNWVKSGISEVNTSFNALGKGIRTVVQQDPASPVVGGPLTYRIVVTNTSSVTLTAITVTDTVSPVIMSVSADQPPGWGLPTVTQTAGGTQYAWSHSGFQMLSGEVYTFTIAGTVGEVCAQATVSNTAWVVGMNYCTNTATRMFASGVSFPVGPALDFKVTKEQEPASPQVGEVITYRVVVTNTAGVTITRLLVVDTVSPVVTGATSSAPAAMAGVTVTDQPGAGTRYEWSSFSAALYPGTSYTFTISGTVGAVCSPTEVANTAYIMAGNSCASATAITNGVSFPVGPALDFKVTKEQTPAAPQVGEAVTYRVVVTNTAEATITRLLVVDTISPVVAGVTTDAPAAMAGVTVTNEPGAGTRYVWSSFSAALYPGTSYTFTISGTVGAVCSPTEVANTAYIMAGTSCDSATAITNAVGCTVNLPATDITVVKQQEPAAPQVGEAITYRTVVTNNGAEQITKMLVVDTVSPVVVGATVSAPAAMGSVVVTSQAGTGTRYVWESATAALDAGSSYTFTITGFVGQVCAATTVANTAYVSAGTPCASSTVLTNSVGHTVAGPVTSVSVVKQQEPATPQVGEAITYRIVVTNTGTTTILAMMVVDTVSPVVTGAVATQPVSFPAPTVIGVTGGTRYFWIGSGFSLKAGESFTFTIAGKVGAVCTPAYVSNTAYVISVADCAEARTFSNRTDLTVAPSALGMQVTKAQVPANPGVGETVTYRYVIGNTGSATITNLLFYDTLSPVVTGASSEQPAAMGAPTVMSTAGSGTLFFWSPVAPLLYPGTAYTLTITGKMGVVCSNTNVAGRATARGSNGCTYAWYLSNVVSCTVYQPWYDSIIIEQQDPSAPGIGEAVTYRIVVTNTGVTTITDLTVTDTVSPVVTGVTTDKPPAFNAAAVTSVAGAGTRYAWTKSAALNFYPGTSMTFTITGRMGYVCAPARVSNTVFMTVATPCDTASQNATVVSCLVNPPTTDVTVTKEQSPPNPDMGEAVTYRIVVANTGSATITGVTVVDTVSPLVTQAVSDKPGGFGAPAITHLGGEGTRYVWTAAGLTFIPGMSYTFTVAGVVGGTCISVVVTNTAYVEAASPCTTAREFTNVVAFQPTGGINFQATVTKELITPSPGIGDAVTYRIVVRNTGEATIQDMIVCDTLSPVITGVIGQAPGAFGQTFADLPTGGGTRWEWTGTGLGMAPGRSYTFTLTGRAGAVCTGTVVSNIALVKSWEDSCNGFLAVQSAPVAFNAAPPSPVVATAMAWANLATGTQIPAPVTGDTIRYRVTVRNDGAATVLGVTVCDTIPTGFASVVSVSAPAGWAVDATRSGTGGNLLAVFTKTALIPGESAIFLVDATIREGGSLVNTAFTTYRDPCGTPGATSPAEAVNQVSLTAAAMLSRLSRVKPNSILVAPNTLTPAAGMVYITLRGTAGATVGIRVYDDGDRLVRTMSIVLDSAGLADTPYDGTGFDGKKLGPGVYWILARGGGIDTRKPFMIAPRRR